jgi:hypothetical protein
MPIRTFLGRQRPIHSQHSITYRTIIEIRKVSLRITHKQIQRIHDRSVLSPLDCFIGMRYLARDFAREKPFIPPFLIDAHPADSHYLNLSEGITGRQSD